MNEQAMKILVIEDDIEERNVLKECAESRQDIEIVAITDSDIEALEYAKIKEPEGIILDLELNNSENGNIDSIELLTNLKSLKNNPIVIVTTHVNSKRTYDILHRKGVDLILYKDQPKYSCEHVFNTFINLRTPNTINKKTPNLSIVENEEAKISNLIDDELNLIGITSNLKGGIYLHDAILYQIKNNNENKVSVGQYLAKKYKRAETTINNGMQQAIIHAWRITPIEEIEQYYKARVSYETGVPTPMQFISYYTKEISKNFTNFT